jgi:predicted O-methyltransferase YrrM
VPRVTRKRLRKLARSLPKYRKRVRRAVYRQWNKRHRRTYAERLDRVPSREELPSLLNRRRLLGRGAEIGVKAGKYSDFLLSRWKGERLISVDPWMEDADEAYVDRANVPQAQHERFYDQTKARLRRYGPRSEIWRATSVEAAERVPDLSLDFVYIDARHDYESVMEDLHAWFPKVRPGGLLAGHDYATGHFPQGDFGVKQAVDEFFAARQIPVYATDGRPPAELFATWLVEIPTAMGADGTLRAEAMPYERSKRA